MKKVPIYFLTMFIILSIVNTKTLQAKTEEGSRSIVNTVEDPNGKINAKYSPDYSGYCSATMISPSIGLTAKHCVGSNHGKKGYIGALYPGQSGTSTPFGMMDVSEYIPNDASDIAIVKGTDENKSASYKYYINDSIKEILPVKEEEIKNLEGKEVYSYGYPSDYVGAPQVRAEGKITRFNKINQTAETTIPVSNGQSGAGVFLKDGNRFLGVVTGAKTGNNGNLVRFTYMNERLVNWFNKQTKNE
ncbi:trypsin-like peptidase domain-containing protein [Staphylococcus hyicus]|uniref:trypsin-like serine peptidase n=1 Tax=Staphylococcus hyicus TaxID=1284 RepID=UPI00211B856A|nr:trypsin-like peptidase domain-containing protein [Staphylococcus hyicus]MCQ9299533.1 trypsin-like peptidase domain-containing protein [Staphylococcus hyicus]